MIVGPPNAGKSSLLNALAGSDRAIVADLPGTTRDLLQETIRVDGVEMTLVDTAGLREEGDAIEREGMRARASNSRAPMRRWSCSTRAIRSAAAPASKPPPACPDRVAAQQSDLLPAQATVEAAILVSARTGAGFDALARTLARPGRGRRGRRIQRARHVDALQRARALLDEAVDGLRRAPNWPRTACAAPTMRSARSPAGCCRMRYSVTFSRPSASGNEAKPPDPGPGS